MFFYCRFHDSEGKEIEKNQERRGDYFLVLFSFFPPPVIKKKKTHILPTMFTLHCCPWLPLRSSSRSSLRSRMTHLAWLTWHPHVIQSTQNAGTPFSHKKKTVLPPLLPPTSYPPPPSSWGLQQNGCLVKHKPKTTKTIVTKKFYCFQVFSTKKWPTYTTLTLFY